MRKWFSLGVIIVLALFILSGCTEGKKSKEGATEPETLKMSDFLKNKAAYVGKKVALTDAVIAFAGANISDKTKFVDVFFTHFPIDDPKTLKYSDTIGVMMTVSDYKSKIWFEDKNEYNYKRFIIEGTVTKDKVLGEPIVYISATKIKEGQSLGKEYELKHNAASWRLTRPENKDNIGTAIRQLKSIAKAKAGITGPEVFKSYEGNNASGQKPTKNSNVSTTDDKAYPIEYQLYSPSKIESTSHLCFDNALIIDIQKHVSDHAEYAGIVVSKHMPPIPYSMNDLIVVILPRSVWDNLRIGDMLELKECVRHRMESQMLFNGERSLYLVADDVKVSDNLENINVRDYRQITNPYDNPSVKARAVYNSLCDTAFNHYLRVLDKERYLKEGR